ncbi:hypothetical protein K438DRAFT_694587 [Mycena galopus ATCC 62051]|nr:hypothetical protein K438DRAFT_694587 [Mycena galopus ATCC 62051]
MTEYDYSPEGHQRFLATQNRIAKWVHSTESASAPRLRSFYSPPPMGSEAFHHSSVTSRRPHASSAHRTTHYRPQAPRTNSHASSYQSASSRSGSGSYSRAPSSLVTPSQSISQAARRSSAPSYSSGPSPYYTQNSSPSHHRSHHPHHRPAAYVISAPAPPPGYRTSGIVIVPRRGHSPQVVFY